jgi:hypothetical protein
MVSIIISLVFQTRGLRFREGRNLPQIPQTNVAGLTWMLLNCIKTTTHCSRYFIFELVQEHLP